MKRIVGRVAIVLLLVVVAPLALLSALEGLLSVGSLVRDLRAIPPAGNPLQATYDSLVGWTAGRDRHPEQREGSALPRVVCSGDELTFGVGVADSATYCAQLGNRTVNAGQRGYDIAQSFLLYRRDLLTDSARHVHVFSVNGTALDRMSLASFAGYPKPRLTVRGKTIAPEQPIAPWTSASRSLEKDNVFAESRFVQLYRRVTGSGSAPDRRNADIALADSILRELSALDSAHGNALLLVYLPMLSDLLPGRADAWRAHLAETSRSLHVPFVDLTPEMRAIPADTVEWMFITPGARSAPGAGRNYTVRGNRWIAERLSAHLAPLKLLQPTMANGR